MARRAHGHPLTRFFAARAGGAGVISGSVRPVFRRRTRATTLSIAWVLGCSPQPGPGFLDTEDAVEVCGGEIEVPTIDGGRSRVKVPAGTQSGKQLRLRGKGMPPLRHGPGLNGEPGDMLIELAVETPVNLTARQKELLREFEAIHADNNPQTHGFFQKIKGFWDEMKG